MKVTLGGDRLGAGKKYKQYLDNYHRSTHNLSQEWTSPMTVGALYPFLVLPATRGDKFEIETHADCITIPTKGPLFGSFKLQIDVFQCPVRLYQAFLHNNPTAVGLKVHQFILPKYHLETKTKGHEAVNNSSLWKYLGLSGIGKGVENNGNYDAQRQIMAAPMLAYYDIYKNYYANKQEEQAYVIGGEKIIIANEYESGQFVVGGNATSFSTEGEYKSAQMAHDIEDEHYIVQLTFAYKNSDTDEYLTEKEYLDFDVNLRNIYAQDITTEKLGKILENSENVIGWGVDDSGFSIIINPNSFWRYKGQIVGYFRIKQYYEKDIYKNIELKAFDLKNIDDMRMAVLSYHTMGSPFRVDQQDYLPYNINNLDASQFPLNGLVVKTYQNDLFNNWINTDWIEGENGIAEITKLNTEDGLKVDAIVMAEKLYNLLNRVVVGGNTYDDYLDAAYEPSFRRHMESPIYVGGMSSEVVFEQIVSTTNVQTEDGNDPLGTLAGRGRHIKRKGGHMYIKVDEPSFIIGIVSLTPRIKYCQGNEFYMTELNSVGDFHVPGLDQIGFQNLIGERLAWWDTQLDGNGGITSRSTIGKVPAWIEYMTAVDKTYGDFANTEVDENGEPIGAAFMVLNRNYARTEDGKIADATTYIDPTKYNYAFAYTNLDAQNFWTEIYSKITARRLMSAKQIPNV